MGNDPIYCFNRKPEDVEEMAGQCVYKECPMFSEELDLCKLELLKSKPKKATTERKPIRDEPQRKPEAKHDTINSLKIGDTSSKEHKINVQGKLVFDASQKDVNKRDGSTGTVADIVISDGTGQLKVSAWDDKADALMVFVKDDEVLIENIYKIKEVYGGVLQADAGKFFKIFKL